mmetsp:Transcript_5792/g.22892  ORF Transcript_5792/g.22892 Transcript_5792/m.22892 type:complete len:203 (+) Transcript_5792:1120-1728(+)
MANANLNLTKQTTRRARSSRRRSGRRVKRRVKGCSRYGYAARAAKTREARAGVRELVAAVGGGSVGYAPRATHFQTANFASSVPWRVILSVSAVVPAAMARTGTYRWATKYATPSGRRSRRAKPARNSRIGTKSTARPKCTGGLDKIRSNARSLFSRARQPSERMNSTSSERFLFAASSAHASASRSQSLDFFALARTAAAI